MKCLFKHMLLPCLFLLSLSATAIKPAIIMDTDMGFDDWLAVLYVLKSPDIHLKAITIDCQGETRCPAGAVNAARLNKLAHRHVPIAIGLSNPTSAYLFPKAIRDYASAMAVQGFNDLKPSHDIVKQSAATLIKQLVIGAARKHQKISIISIGTAANIANAYELAKKMHQSKLFQKGLGMIFKGGGAFGEIINHRITNINIHGNIPITHLYKSRNKTAEWNIYAAAPAMQTLLAAKLPITFIPLNATDAVPMSNRVYNHLKKHEKNHPLAKFTANAMRTLYAMQNGWQECEFWDTSVTVAAIHPSIVSRVITKTPTTVLLNKNAKYGTTWVSNKASDLTTVDYHINPKQFYNLLYKVIV